MLLPLVENCQQYALGRLFICSLYRLKDIANNRDIFPGSDSFDSTVDYRFQAPAPAFAFLETASDVSTSVTYFASKLPGRFRSVLTKSHEQRVPPSCRPVAEAGFSSAAISSKKAVIRSSAAGYSLRASFE